MLNILNLILSGANLIQKAPFCLFFKPSERYFVKTKPTTSW